MIPDPQPDDPKVKFRKVWNDVNVGQWYEVDFPVFPPTLAGLEEALNRPALRAEGWNPNLLERDGFDKHLYRHGPRVQFWVPSLDEATQATAAGDMAKAMREFEDTFDELPEEPDSV